jgi:hypothetical protein
MKTSGIIASLVFTSLQTVKDGKFVVYSDTAATK